MQKKQTAILLMLEPNESFALKKFLEVRDWQVETFKDIDSCWRGLGKFTPDLLIADVICMSNAERSLLDHPLIIHRKVPIALYCHQHSRPLLHSLLSHWNLGVIEQSPEYATAMVPILLRLEEWKNQQVMVEQGQQDISRLRRDLQQLLGEKNVLDFKLSNYQKIEKMDLEIKKYLKSGEDYFVACAKMLQQQDWVTHFAFYGLLENGRRLFSPELPAGKSHALSEIYLPALCSKGLSAEAQAMAIQIFNNIGDGHLMLLEIDQMSQRPKYILLLKTPDRELFQHMELDALERMLDYNFQNSKSPNTQSKMTNGPWELASFLESTFHRLDEDLKLLGPTSGKGEELGELMSVDLSALLEQVNSKKMGRFFWKKFANDLQSKLKALVGQDVEMIEMGLQTLYLLSPKNNISGRLEIVQNFLKGFPLWRYFEHPNHTALWGVTIIAKMVPLAPSAIKDTAVQVAQVQHLMREMQ
jgi:hypothetical protein